MKLFKYLLLGVVSLSLIGCNDSDSDSQTVLPIIPPAAEVISLNVSPAVSDIVVGEKLQYNAVLVNNTTNNAVDVTAKTTWRSTNSSVATIDANGLATAVAAGTASIIGTFDGRDSALAIIKVTDLSSNPSLTLTSIDVEVASQPTTSGQFVVGTSVQLRAVGNLSDGSKRDLTTAVTWAAVTPSTVAVDQAGLATALAAGAATVTATYSQNLPAPVVGTIFGTAVAATIQQLIVEGANEAPLGVTIPLQALATYNNNAPPVSVTTQATWSSSNPSVATVDSQGVVSSVAAGDTVITATFSGLSTQHPVRYRAAEVVALIIVDENNSPITGTTQKIYLVDDVSYPDDPEGLSPNAFYAMAYAEYSDGSIVYVNQDAVWTSSNQNAAYINYLQGSFVFGRDLATGVVITAIFGGKSASYNVDVLAPAGAPTLNSIDLRLGDNGATLNGTTIDVEVGAKQWVTAYGNYSDGSVQNINSKVFYSSTDPRVAAVFDSQDSNIRGISVGTADISAEWQGKKATVTANVVPSTAPVLQSIEIQKGYCEAGDCPVIDTSGSSNLKLKPGQTQYITAWGIYSGSSTRVYINTQVLWSSADNSIASMPLNQSSSNVTGVLPGSTTVSARLNGITGSANVDVALQ